MTREPSTFFAQSRSVKSILIIGSGALGDSIHSLPALRLIREAYPDAELHVMAAAPAFYQAFAPWVKRAWPGIARRFIDNLALIGAVRAARFDAVIVIHPHHRMVLLAALSGAPFRLTRKADLNKRWWWQPLVMTHVVDEPFHTQMMYRQLWSLMKRAGLPGGDPRFGVALDAAWLSPFGIEEAAFGRYVHVSLFTTARCRELPAAQQLEIVSALIDRYERVVLTCSEIPREKAAMGDLVRRLPKAPWRVFNGNLAAHQFVALVARARLHLGGDSGGLHAALLGNVPRVAWVRSAHLDWVPPAGEPGVRTLLSTDPAADALHGIDTARILAAAAELAP